MFQIKGKWMKADVCKFNGYVWFYFNNIFCDNIKQYHRNISVATLAVESVMIKKI